MDRRLWAPAVLLAVLAAGCSPTAPTQAGPEDRVGPHRGVLVRLPGDRGYAEVVNSKEAGRPGGRERAPAQLLVYFLAPDLKAPAGVAASGVSVKLTAVTDQPETVPLEPAAEPGDPVGKNRFASKKGPYHLSGAHGELSATLDGQPFKAEFDGGR
jgi:hypothetical protein